MSGASTPYMIEEEFLIDDKHSIKFEYKDFSRAQCENEKLSFDQLSSLDNSDQFNTFGPIKSPLYNEENSRFTSLSANINFNSSDFDAKSYQFQSDRKSEID